MPATTRRAVLAALGLGTVGRPGRPATARERSPSPDPVRLAVQVHPDGRLGWSDLTRAVAGAVRTGVEQVAYRLEHGHDVPVEISVTRGAPIPETAVATSSYQQLFADVEEWLRDEDAYDPGACHLYLPDEPFNQALGYGGANGNVTGDGAVAFANVGATNTWDGRAVSENIAVHEWLHTVVDGDAVEAQVGSRCEHDLGAVVMRELGTVLVTPLATAYADDTVYGGETRWHGSGCYNHGSFSRHDGLELRPRRWEHTWQLSEATLRATSRFVRTHLR
ncbi:hypothetical protein [Haloarchaeobius amylolyticus]|uniref:hypothetical protein n=1 Tax=Haloarchaeobius amylolyticus TaxID=1198296 RepID=UPI00227120F9|nr:hypothetical protein [Haloarchaeobius amylolyticus]